MGSEGEASHILTSAVGEGDGHIHAITTFNPDEKSLLTIWSY